MKRVLVTGAGGQLGKTIQDLAPEYPDLDFQFLDKKYLDITQTDQVMEKFREFIPDYCINCAAYTNVDQAEKTPEKAYEVNVKGVENLVQACAETQTVLIHISTDYVFDGTKEGGYYPSDKPNPINEYGRTKLMGEQAIQKGLKRFFIIRTSWLYSKKYAPNFYLTILEKAKRGERLLVTDAQVGCPTDTENLASYVLNLIASGQSDFSIRHFTDGVAMSWFDFAGHILKENTNNLSLLERGDFRVRALRPSVSILKSE